MNWLAHVFLSEPDVECRLGNLLADLVKGKARQAMSPRFRRGLACHQAIDAFTDYHPVAGLSKTPLAAGFPYNQGDRPALMAGLRRAPHSPRVGGCRVLALLH